MRNKVKILKNTSPQSLQSNYSNKKLVAIALPLLSEGDISLVQSIREELEKTDSIEVMLLTGGYEATLRRLAEERRLAGAIGEFISNRWMESLTLLGAAVIQIGSGAPAIGGVPSVSTDLESMSREAAQALLGREMKSIAYLGPIRANDPLQLGSLFMAGCRRQGVEVRSCPATSEVEVRHFLCSLNLPAGILCASDRLARLAILAGREEGIRVPGDLAVIGVGNSRLESLHAGIAISSFELPLEEIGRRAGLLMNGLLEKKTASQDQLKPVPARLHERESSLRSPSGIARALAYLRSHPETPITAGELARLAGMSRRSFETTMRETTGASPGKYLQQMRRTRAEHLLQTTSLSIQHVARACGYTEPAVFSAAFRRWSGKSPREFRGICIDPRSTANL